MKCRSNQVRSVDSAKNKNYIKVTPHKSIYIYMLKKKSKMCNRIKKSAKQDVQKQVRCEIKHVCLSKSWLKSKSKKKSKNRDIYFLSISHSPTFNVLLIKESKKKVTGSKKIWSSTTVVKPHIRSATLMIIIIQHIRNYFWRIIWHRRLE